MDHGRRFRILLHSENFRSSPSTDLISHNLPPLSVTWPTNSDTPESLQKRKHGQMRLWTNSKTLSVPSANSSWLNDLESLLRKSRESVQKLPHQPRKRGSRF
ncbi:hypothetical protein L5515_007086 [Caenorhabditis briggsae]|uniref:Uncharacterized protein n=1 Tax=Caenorhabditis briggsae TaxID=6238 RepID=A0AAE9JJL5_CAEBR|nr:hypothetical protein L5515_007086 [Caenorhabditis briggsae]